MEESLAVLALKWENNQVIITSCSKEKKLNEGLRAEANNQDEVILDLTSPVQRTKRWSLLAHAQVTLFAFFVHKLKVFVKGADCNRQQ
jgi:hypothetical protein